MKLWKQILYWTGYLILLAAGMALSYYRLLPVRNTLIFLFSILWVWNGLSGLLGLNPQIKTDDRRYRLIYCLAVAGMGLAWFPLSMLPQSHQARYVFLAAAPFLTVIAVSKFVLNKKS